GSRDVSRAAEDDRPFPPCRAAVGVLTRWPAVPPLRCAHFVRPHGARRTGHVLVPVVSARPHLAVAAAVAYNGDERAIGPRDLLNRHAWNLPHGRPWHIERNLTRLHRLNGVVVRQRHRVRHAELIRRIEVQAAVYRALTVWRTARGEQLGAHA